MKRKIPAFVGVVALTASSMASAALIEWWGYEVNNGFGEWAPNGAVTPSGVSTLGVGYYTKLMWGTLTANNPTGPNGPPAGTTGSSFEVADPVLSPTPTDLRTNGGWVAGAALTHNNWEITGTTLDTATLTSRITLTPFATNIGPAIGPSLAEQADFLIDFLETTNAGTCLVPEGATQKCPDIFVLKNPQDLVQTFATPDYIYTVTLEITGLTDLSSTVCNGVLPGDPVPPGGTCKGFSTPEFASTSIGTQFRIAAREVPIPAPATLAIMGLGLVAMGAVRRRKSS